MAGGSAFQRVKIKIHPEGFKFIAIFAAITVVLGLFSSFLFWVGVVLTLWCALFFRDPVRAVPQRAGLVVSPADGIVSMIERVATPPELGMQAAEATRISVFMDVFNCHVNRAPIGGTITTIAYTPGKFVNASLDKASEHNERNGLVITMDDGRELGVVQIAGLVARRILCEAQQGARIDTGERFGLIRFGSRLDIYLPEGVAPLVALGQTMVAGETVLADLTGSDAQRSARSI